MQRLHPSRRDAATVRHDRRHALRTLLLGTTLGAATTLLVLAGLVPLDTTWPGARRFAGEVVVYVLLFDAYFYGLHRVLHTRTLYRRVHVVHHRSRTPSVVTALAFHPAEALLIAAFMPVTMCLLPIHLGSLVVVSAFLSGSILLAHCGYEVFPAWWESVPVLGWYVTPRVHDAHHQTRACNYGATLSVFDRVFGTLAPTSAHRGRTLPIASTRRSTASSAGSPPARANET